MLWLLSLLAGFAALSFQPMLQRLRDAPLLSPLHSWQPVHPCSGISWKGKAPGVYLKHRARGEPPGGSSTGTWLVGRNMSQPWSKWQPRPGSKSQCKQEPHLAVAGDLQLLLEQRRIKKRYFPSFSPLSVCSMAVVHVPSRAAGWLYGTRVSSANIVFKMNSVRWKDHSSLLTFSTT